MTTQLKTVLQNLEANTFTVMSIQVALADGHDDMVVRTLRDQYRDVPNVMDEMFGAVIINMLKKEPLWSR